MISSYKEVFPIFILPFSSFYFSLLSLEIFVCKENDSSSLKNVLTLLFPSDHFSLISYIFVGSTSIVSTCLFIISGSNVFNFFFGFAETFENLYYLKLFYLSLVLKSLRLSNFALLVDFYRSVFVVISDILTPSDKV